MKVIRVERKMKASTHTREEARREGDVMSLINAWLDLKKVLEFKKENLTPVENNMLNSLHRGCVKDFTACALAGCTAACIVTMNFSTPIRVYVSFDQVLTMDGSLLQKEFTNIMVTKYQNDPSVMQLLSKHFYLERIFNDSSNTPKLIWRDRNFFSEAVHGHRTHDQVSYCKSQDHFRNDSNDKSQSENVTNNKNPNLETKHTFINAGTTWESDPLDRVFGYTQPLEDTIHSDSSNKQPSGTQNRVRRRSRRLRRKRNHDDLSNSEPTTAV